MAQYGVLHKRRFHIYYANCAAARTAGAAPPVSGRFRLLLEAGPGQETETVNSTLSAAMAVHSSLSEPNEILCPGLQQTSWSPTRRAAWPPWSPRRENCAPKVSTWDPLPPSVAEQGVREQAGSVIAKYPAAAPTPLPPLAEVAVPLV